MFKSYVYLYHPLFCASNHGFLPTKIRGGSCFSNLDKEGGHEKFLRNSGLVKLFFVSFPSENCFHYNWNIFFSFFCLVNI